MRLLLELPRGFGRPSWPEIAGRLGLLSRGSLGMQMRARDRALAVL